MSSQIEIKIEQDNLPSGQMLSEDLRLILEALEKSLARIAQQETGRPVDQRLSKKVTERTKILIGLQEGSSIALAKPAYFLLQEPESRPRHLIDTSFSVLCDAINYFQTNHDWPSYLPRSTRESLAEMFHKVHSKVNRFSCAIRSSSPRRDKSAQLVINQRVIDSLAQEDENLQAISVELVGDMTYINKEEHCFQITADKKHYRINADQDFIAQYVDIEATRWKRVRLKALKKPAQKALYEPKDIELATDSDVDGLKNLEEAMQSAIHPAFLHAQFRVNSFRTLQPGWDSYSALAPDKRALDFSLEWLQRAFQVLTIHDINPVQPFVVPSVSGGVQFEWETEYGELEIEIDKSSKMSYLYTYPDGNDEEGNCEDWEAIQLLLEVCGRE